MEEKIKIDVDLCQGCLYGTFDEVIEILNNLKRDYTNQGYENLRIEEGDEDRHDYIIGSRLETDEEQIKRIKYNTEMKVYWANINKLETEKQRKEYERLKLIFEPQS